MVSLGALLSRFCSGNQMGTAYCAHSLPKVDAQGKPLQLFLERPRLDVAGRHPHLAAAPAKALDNAALQGDWRAQQVCRQHLRSHAAGSGTSVHPLAITPPPRSTNLSLCAPSALMPKRSPRQWLHLGDVPAQMHSPYTLMPLPPYICSQRLCRRWAHAETLDMAVR